METAKEKVVQVAEVEGDHHEYLLDVEQAAKNLVAVIYKGSLWRKTVWKNEFTKLHNLLFQTELEI